MYFAGYEIHDIIMETNIPQSVINDYVFNRGWLEKRENLDATSVSAYCLSKVTVFERTSGLALKCITKSLEGLTKQVCDGEKELSVDEISKLARVVTDLDKISRLEQGRSTEIITNIGLTPERVREIIASDPISTEVTVDVEFKELDEL